MLRVASASGLAFSPARVFDGRRRLRGSETALVFGPAAVADGRRMLTASAAQSFGKPERFKMIGFDPSTASYEVWVALHAPNTQPPSGHELSDVAHVPLLSESP